MYFPSVHMAKPMQESGETSDGLNVYSTVCCGSEIIILIVEGATFPPCPNCQRPTTWKFLESDSPP